MIYFRKYRFILIFLKFKKNYLFFKSFSIKEYYIKLPTYLLGIFSVHKWNNFHFWHETGSVIKLFLQVTQTEIIPNMKNEDYEILLIYYLLFLAHRSGSTVHVS